MVEEKKNEQPEFSLLDAMPSKVVAPLAGGGALYLIFSIFSSKEMMSAIKSSPNITAVVIAFIGFAAAYTIAKYIAYVMEVKDTNRHREIEGWFAMVRKDIEELNKKVDDNNNDLNYLINKLEEIKDMIRDDMSDYYDDLCDVIKDNKDSGSGAASDG